jgi:hypothetical protein
MKYIVFPFVLIIKAALLLVTLACAAMALYEAARHKDRK